MKLFTSSTTILIVLMSLFCCKDDDTAVISNVAPVSDVTYVAANGAILFSWANPAMEGLAYVEISYTDKSGEVRRCLVKDHLTQQWIYGLGDKDYYDFRFIVYDVHGNKSAPVDVMAAALEPTVNLFQGRVGVSVVAKGVEVTWDNDFGEDFYIRVSYTDLNGGEYKYEVAAPAGSSGKESVAIGAKISGTQTLLVNIDVVDVNNNVSESKTVVYHKLNAGKLDRSGWTIPAVSSEEKDSAPATNILDGDVKTFWHSRWTTNPQNFPHWLVIDLGSKKRIEKIGVQHRQDKIMARRIDIYGTNKSGTSTKDEDWSICATLEMEQKSGADVYKAEQVFSFPAPVEYRYIKLKLLTAGEGDAKNAGLSEVYLYGADL